VRRLPFLVWCAFILYGSFIPFEFSADPDAVLESLTRARATPFPRGAASLSVSDLLTNVLVFVPFGYLAVDGARGRRFGGGRVREAATAGLGALALATAIELGQLFTPGRVASVLDVLTDVAGAAVGVIAAHGVGWIRFGPGGSRARQLLRAAPTLVPLGLLALSFVMDAFYPFVLVSSRAAVRTKLSRLGVVRSPWNARRFWGDVVMDRIVLVGLLAALVRRALERLHAGPSHPAVTAWLATSVVVGGLELGKVVVQGREPRVEDALLVAAGALAGVTAVPVILGSRLVAARPARALVVLAAALLVYAELTPFRLRTDPAGVASRLAQIEWLPFSAYYWMDIRPTLLDVWNKALVSGFFGFSVAAAGRGTGQSVAVAGFLAALLLETTQLVLAGRVPSLGDVLLLGCGACLGGRAWEAFRELESPEAETEAA